MENQSQEINKDNKVNLNLPASILMAGLFIAAAIFLRGGSSNLTQTQNVQDSNIPIKEVTEEDFMIGDLDADIVLVEYSDFSCGFCGRYHPTMKKIVEEYKGRVTWVYRHLPIFNKPAAIASSCVGINLGDEAFFKYADKLFENQQSINDELLKKEALALGLAESVYDSCVNDQEIVDEINKEFTSNRVLAGFNSTPTTVLITKEGDKYSFAGALPYEEVSSLIDTFLEK